jgi:uncharacterized protein (DUF433 family)
VSDRPVITIDPGMAWGDPAIKGVSTEAIAGRVRAGEDFDAVALDFRLSRHEVILACWYEGTAGVYRREWSAWTNAVGPALGGHRPLDVDAVGEPPRVGVGGG